jgi:hypothetical protein
LRKYVDQSKRNENPNRCFRLPDGCPARRTEGLLRSNRGLSGKDGGQNRDQPKPREAESKAGLEGEKATDLELNPRETEATMAHQELLNKEAEVEATRALND